MFTAGWLEAIEPLAPNFQSYFCQLNYVFLAAFVAMWNILSNVFNRKHFLENLLISDVWLKAWGPEPLFGSHQKITKSPLVDDANSGSQTRQQAIVPTPQPPVGIPTKFNNNP
jgi:hypothetical protein